MKKFIRRSFLCVICCFGIKTVYSNPFTYTIGARSQALGGNGITLNDIWAAHNNPAALVGIKSTQIGIYQGNQYMLKELSLSALAIGKAINDLSSVSICYMQFGTTFYKEQQLGLGYARALHEKLYASVQFHYLRVATIADDENLSTNSIVVDIGVFASLSNKIRLGVNVFNPNRSKMNTPINAIISTSFKTGLSYTPSTKALISIELEKVSKQDPNLKGGIEYSPHSKAYIRAGATNNFTQPALGGGYILNHFQIDIASSYHTVLGFSPSFSLTYVL